MKISFGRLSSCAEKIENVVSSTRAATGKRKILDSDGALCWISEEVSALPAVLFAYGGFCSAAGAQCLAISLEAHGCEDIARAGEPNFELCSPEAIDTLMPVPKLADTFSEHYGGIAG
jgi:hypothetical protein